MINKSSLYKTASVMTLGCLFFGCSLFGATNFDTPAGGISVSVEKTPTTPSDTSSNAMSETSGAMTAQSRENVADIINSKPELSTLAKAIKAAGLESTLQNGNFIIFAPDNAAFDKLPADQLQSLLKPENKDKLRDILLFHVVAKDVRGQPLQSGEIKAANGKDLNLEVSSGEVTVNNVQVKSDKIVGKNGVIHVIDTVLIPQ